MLIRQKFVLFCLLKPLKNDSEGCGQCELVQSAQGIGVFNLVANVREAKVLCFAFVISHVGLWAISVVSPSFKRSVSHLAQVQSDDARRHRKPWFGFAPTLITTLWSIITVFTYQHHSSVTSEYFQNIILYSLYANLIFNWPSCRSLRGNLQGTHKLETTVQMQISKCVSALHWSKCINDRLQERGKKKNHTQLQIIKPDTAAIW